MPLGHELGTLISSINDNCINLEQDKNKKKASNIEKKKIHISIIVELLFNECFMCRPWPHSLGMVV